MHLIRAELRLGLLRAERQAEKAYEALRAKQLQRRKQQHIYGVKSRADEASASILSLPPEKEEAGEEERGVEPHLHEATGCLVSMACVILCGSTGGGGGDAGERGGGGELWCEY